MIGTGFISNQITTPISVVFLDGGDFSNNKMSEAYVMGTSDEGRYYTIAYKGAYFRVPIENVKFIIEIGWMVANKYEPTGTWTEYTVDYSAYLQPIGV